MTQKDLDSLEDVTPRFGVVEKTISGRLAMVPVQLGPVGAIFTGPCDGVFSDENGNKWLVGEYQGRRVKRMLGM